MVRGVVAQNLDGARARCVVRCFVFLFFYVWEGLAHVNPKLLAKATLRVMQNHASAIVDLSGGAHFLRTLAVISAGMSM
jgi:hypothetical protein